MVLRGRCARGLLVLGCVAAAQAWGAPHPRAVPEYRGGLVRRLEAGRLLVATPALRGPFFRETVVLLLEYSAAEGALGVVVNRPSGVPLAQVLPGEPALEDSAQRAWVGGPVGRDRISVLFREEGAPPLEEADSLALVDGVRVGGTPAVLRALAESHTGEEHWRAYLGYAGWAPGQLEGEVAGGSWGIEKGEARWIFAADAAAVWPALVERSEGLQTRRDQRCATTYAIQAGSSGACSRRVKTPLPSSLFASVPSQ